MTKLKLGINNSFAVKRWPEADIWAEIVGSVFELDLVQYSFDLVDPRVRKSVRKRKSLEAKMAADEYGIRIHSTFTGMCAYSSNLLMHPDLGMRIDAIEWYEEALCMTKEMESFGTGGHVASQSYCDYNDDERRSYLLDFLIESLKYLSRRSSQLGLRFMLWETMPVPREPPCNLDDAKELYKAVNRGAPVPVGFCIDTGHRCTWSESEGDLDIYQWVRALGDLSPVIHLQQTDGKMDRHWPFTPEFNRLGIIEAERLIDEIENSGAKEVILILEIIHPFEEKEKKVLEELGKSVDYWKDYV